MMKPVTLSQVSAWAALKPAVNLSAHAKLAWRRFVPVTIDGMKLAFPAKGALAWMQATGAQSMSLDLRFVDTVQGISVRGEHGTSRITLCVYTKSIPCEEPYDLRVTNGGWGGVADHCELADMGDPSSDDDRKAANAAKRLEKAQRDAREAKRELDNATTEADRMRTVLEMPFTDAVKLSRQYLSVSRMRRAYERNPEIAPVWMLPTYETSEWDAEAQTSVKVNADTRKEHADLVTRLNQAIAERAAFKVPTRHGFPVYGPKWQKLTKAIDDARANLLRFLESRFGDYLAASSLPSSLRWSYQHDLTGYIRARRFMKTWDAKRDDLESRVNEAKARLDKVAPGWGLWQKDEKASWVHESDADKLAKARELGATKVL